MPPIVQNLFKNWKTTSAGLTMVIGSTIHLIFAVRDNTANENTWTISITGILGGLGLMFAGDADKTSVKTDQPPLVKPDITEPKLP